MQIFFKFAKIWYLSSKLYWKCIHNLSGIFWGLSSSFWHFIIFLFSYNWYKGLDLPFFLVSSLVFNIYFQSEFLLYFLVSVTNGIYVIVGKLRGIPCYFTLRYLCSPIGRDLGFYSSTMSLNSIKTLFFAISNSART